MGNAIVAGAGTGVGGRRKAKIMKINGEFFKLGTPAKVGDVIDNYPGHILLDADDFRRFNLRARPLDPESELQPKKIYLLVELPRFPTAEEAEDTLQRTNSSEILNERSQPPENCTISHLPASEISVTGPLAAGESGDTSGEDHPQSTLRVKVKLPKAQVERILEQSKNDAEAAEKIIDLCIDDGGRAAADEEAEEVVEEIARKDRWTGIEGGETTEKVSFSKYSLNLNPWRSPYTNHHSKYEKLTNN